MARTITEQLAVAAAYVMVQCCKLGAYSPSWIWEVPLAPEGSLTSTWLGGHSAAVLSVRTLTLLLSLYPMPTLALALRAQILAETWKDNGLKRQGLELQREYEKSQQDLHTWKTLVRPGLLTIINILLVQAAMFPACLVAALLLPNALEAFRKAVAKEVSKAANNTVKALDADKGLSRLPASPEAAKQLKLQEGATVKDAAVSLQRSIPDA